jgi:hypothetical protein
MAGEDGIPREDAGTPRAAVDAAQVRPASSGDGGSDRGTRRRREHGDGGRCKAPPVFGARRRRRTRGDGGGTNAGIWGSAQRRGARSNGDGARAVRG